MFSSGFKVELGQACLFLALSALIGFVVGMPAIAICVGLGLYIFRLYMRIYQLEDWVNRTRRGIAPPKEELTGVWADIGYDVQLLLIKHDKEKQRLQTVVNRVQEMASALTDAVILVDQRGNMEWWNKAAKALFHFHDIDLGHKLANLIRHPRFIHYFDAQDYAAPLELKMWQANLQLEFQIHAFGDGERLVVARDITRLFKLEEMRKDFVANVSHELRTPLTVIRGYLETLTDSPQCPPSWAKALQQMEQQAQRMTLLINDLITLTKLETDQKEVATIPVPIASMIAGIINDAEAVSGYFSYTIDVDPHLALVGNERELRSAFSNLIVNAVNHSGKGSAIEVRSHRQATEVIISVIDNGAGIDEKHIPRLTERFYRVDASRSVASGGTGLGLAIVKHVLLRHNAELKIQSKLGKGSTFSCYFPNAIVREIKAAEISPGIA